MLPVIPMWVHIVIMFVALAFVFWRGGRYEKLAAGCYVMSNLLMFGFGSGDGTLPTEIEIGVYVLEAAFFTALAFAAKRFWLIAAAVFAHLEIASAAANTLIDIDRWTYATVQLGWFYAIWGAITVATCTTAARLRLPDDRLARG